MVNRFKDGKLEFHFFALIIDYKFSKNWSESDHQMHNIIFETIIDSDTPR